MLVSQSGQQTGSDVIPIHAIKINIISLLAAPTFINL